MSLADNPRAVPGEAGEVFRDVAFGYSVSNLGRVRSPSSRILVPRRARNGYVRVSIRGRDVSIHRLVLIAFRGAPPSLKHEADHRNKVRDDNRLSNLRWRLKRLNLADRTFMRGEQHPFAKLSTADVRLILSFPRYRGAGKTLAAQFGVPKQLISDIRTGKTWTHLQPEKRTK